MKKCSRCGELKAHEEFHKKGPGFQAYCKSCFRAYNGEWLKDNAGHARTRKTNWSRNNRGKVRNSYLKMRFGISLAQYEELLQKQEGKCAICSRTQTRTLPVDHDHITGAVRGLLCTNCNHLLGKAKDDVNILTAAIRYLLQRTIT